MPSPARWAGPLVEQKSVRDSVATYDSTLAPWSPWSPESPWSPWSPESPWSPWSPESPWSPWSPESPWSPWSPWSPGIALVALVAGIALVALVALVALESPWSPWSPESPWSPWSPVALVALVARNRPGRRSPGHCCQGLRRRCPGPGPDCPGPDSLALALVVVPLAIVARAFAVVALALALVPLALVPLALVPLVPGFPWFGFAAMTVAAENSPSAAMATRGAARLKMVFTFIPLVGGLVARPSLRPLSSRSGLASPTQVMTRWEEVNPWNEGMHASSTSPGKGQSARERLYPGVTAQPRTGS